jgi:hypothetical protein
VPVTSTEAARGVEADEGAGACHLDVHVGDEIDRGAAVDGVVVGRAVVVAADAALAQGIAGRAFFGEAARGGESHRGEHDQKEMMVSHTGRHSIERAARATRNAARG